MAAKKRGPGRPKGSLSGRQYTSAVLIRLSPELLEAWREMVALSEGNSSHLMRQALWNFLRPTSEPLDAGKIIAGNLYLTTHGQAKCESITPRGIFFETVDGSILRLLPSEVLSDITQDQRTRRAFGLDLQREVLSAPLTGVIRPCRQAQSPTKTACRVARCNRGLGGRSNSQAG